MAFWGRVGGTSRFRLLSLRGYGWCRSVLPEATISRAVVNGGSRQIGHLDGEKWSNPCSSPSRQSLLAQFTTVRSFAAPASAKKAKEKDINNGPRLNEDIVSECVRLVSDDGHDIMTRVEALRRAKTLGFDLVEVDHLAKPPVCKIMDYHQERYKKATKDKERAKSKADTSLRKGDCKEVRFTGKIEKKDLEMKAETVKRLMESGYRVKVVAEATKKANLSQEEDLGSVLSRLYNLIEDISALEGAPRVEKRVAYVIVRHAKFGTKKNPPKKISSASETNGIKQTSHSQGHTTANSKQENVLKTNQSDLRSSKYALPHHQIRIPPSAKAGFPVTNSTCKPFHPVSPTSSLGKHTTVKPVPSGARPESDHDSEQQRNKYGASPNSEPLPELSNRYKKSNPTGQPSRAERQPPPFRRNEGMLNPNRQHSPRDPDIREGVPSGSFGNNQNYNRYPSNANRHDPSPRKNFQRTDSRQDSSSSSTRKSNQDNAP